MNRALAEAIVDCLRLSGGAPDVRRLTRFNIRDWQRTFRWLDRSNLALYLLRRLRELEAVEVLPRAIRMRFEGNLAENRRRLDYIASEFASINQRFNRAGVNFTVVKGFALVPSFCPDAVLRTACDLDYLLDRPSLPAAQHALEEEGYYLQGSSDIEFKFCKSSTRRPSVSDDPYSDRTEPLVELHLAFWKSKETGFVVNEPEFPAEQITSCEWHGLHFPALTEEHSFRLQILHVFQHTLESWIKLCWLLEIGYFVRARACDHEFWDRVDAGAREMPQFTEFAAIVMGLTERVFGVALPPSAIHWKQSLPPAAELWLENYSQRWVIEDHPLDNLNVFPAAKLCLLLHQEYIPDPETRKQVIRRRLFPWKRPQQVASPVDNNPAGRLRARWLQGKFGLRRLIFHLGSSLRYSLALPHWRHLNRSYPVFLPGSTQNTCGPDVAPPASLERLRGARPKTSD